MTRFAFLALLSVVFFVLAPARAERRHDPLNPEEVDQLREATLEPETRLKLFLTFARARLVSLEQARSDPKTTDRGEVTHQWLQDFLDIYDELNDNIDMYNGRKEDLRKPLHAVIDADTEFQAKLRALKDSANVTKAEAKQYEFMLTTALETLDSSLEDHRQLLQEQDEAAKEKKKEKR
jgi:hypothetical protein